MKLHICSDFDLTILRIHTGGVYRKLTLENFVNPDKTRQIIRACLDKSHYFSIVTHGDSKEMIEEAIKLLDFTDDEIGRIAIIAKRCSDKNTHIREAKEFHGCNGNSRTILCDDDFTNIYKASELGLAVIQALEAERGTDVHFDALLRIIARPHEACKICAEYADTHNYDYALPHYRTGERLR